MFVIINFRLNIKAAFIAVINNRRRLILLQNLFNPPYVQFSKHDKLHLHYTNTTTKRRSIKCKIVYCIEI